jgi:hypothetical protein
MAGRRTEQRHGRRFSPAAVALVWFWALVLGGLIAAVATLQVLGPPRPPAPKGVAMMPAVPAPSAAPAAAVAPAVRNGQSGGAIAAPIATLQEPFGPGGATLPRIGPGGQMPMRAYAAPFDAADPRPRVAVLLAGLGMAQADSEQAIRDTPAAISLAFSPYATHPEALEAEARSRGHELLVSLPMEPVGYPLNDAGNEALRTGLSAEENHQRLLWALSFCHGCVGATAAMSGLMGERFAASPQMPAVLAELASRGLLYIAPSPLPTLAGAATTATPGQRTADVVLDDPPVAADIGKRLAQLEQIAHDRGTALGVAGRPDPVTVGQLAAWAASLGARGLVLVPVSALVPPLPPFHPTTQP